MSDPNTGLTGLAVTDENRNSYKHIISIPESSREEMFELAKKEFLNENGTLNGDTTKMLSGKLNDAPSGRLFRADLEFLQRCPSL